MSCTSPHFALLLGKKSDGTSIIKFLPPRPEYSLAYLEETYGSHSVIAIPCGKCDSCIESKMKEWSLRCYFESLDHNDNCFVTLTYDDDHCPKKLIKKDFQDFIKALRNKGIKCRYFGCGEYGSSKFSHRPHYHICLFGFFPDDCKPIGKSSKGFWLFKSKFLESLWSKGIVTVQEFTPETAGYCAGYCFTKDISSRGFQLMSKRPGIGSNYALSLKPGCNDNIVGPHGFVSHLPRFFMSFLDKDTLESIKERRIANCRLSIYSEMLDRHVINKEELYAIHESLNSVRVQKYKKSIL